MDLQKGNTIDDGTCSIDREGIIFKTNQPNHY